MSGSSCGHDRARKDVRLVELGDIGLGDPLLLVVGIEDGRAILSAPVRSLIVQLGRIVRNRKINLQNLAVGNLLRIEGHRDRLGVAGPAGADHLVMRRFFLAAGIAGQRLGDAFGVLENTACTPQKQPPAKTMVCEVAPAGTVASSAGGGIMTAGSSVRPTFTVRPTSGTTNDARTMLRNDELRTRAICSSKNPSAARRGNDGAIFTARRARDANHNWRHSIGPFGHDFVCCWSIAGRSRA